MRSQLLHLLQLLPGPFASTSTQVIARKSIQDVIDWKSGNLHQLPAGSGKGKPPHTNSAVFKA